MEDVLSRWEQRDPQCSLERLVSILREIQRLDVVCELGYPVDGSLGREHHGNVRAQKINFKAFL